jgi:glutamate/tyrosine decarboxylase-like PLP-dependent enzyme
MLNEKLHKDLSDLEKLIDLVSHQGIDFLEHISQRPTSTNASVQVSDSLSSEGLGGEETLKLFNAKFEPIIVGTTGPRYWGFVIGGSTPASIMGDLLATFYDQNTFSTKGQGDVSALIEIETIKLLLDLFGLPKGFLGGFVTGATMSNFTCLGVARQWMGKQKQIDIAKEGVPGGIKVLSSVPHSSSIKSLSMLGMGSNHVQHVKVLGGNREAIDVADLQYQIKQLNDEPFILIASAGTVNTVDFDDFEKIAELKTRYKFWLHIDAAFGAFAACSPKHKHLLNGWEVADSITIDCHKWLNVPYESAFFLVREEHKILQTETFQNTNAPYLGDPLENFSYLNFLPENSRRLRALPAWFTLNAYGKKGYQGIVENSIAMAGLFGKFIEESGWLQLLAPVRLNNICFTLKGEDRQELVPLFLKTLNDTGKVFMSPTIYNGQKGIRAAFVNWRTTEADIKLVIRELEKLKP